MIGLRKWLWPALALAAWMMFIYGVTDARAEVYGGDSIADGAGHAAHAPTLARKGAGSCEIARKVPHSLWGWVIVSAGVNDQGRCVEQVRQNIGTVAQVIWIVPPRRYARARAAIFASCRRHGDKYVTYIPGRDGLHPRSYSELVDTIHAAEE
jgi:hypothetical protein